MIDKSELMCKAALASRRLVEEMIRQLEEQEERLIEKIERDSNIFLSTIPEEIQLLRLEDIMEQNWDITTLLNKSNVEEQADRVSSLRESIKNYQKRQATATPMKGGIGPSETASASTKLWQVKGVKKFIDRKHTTNLKNRVESQCKQGSHWK